MIILKTDKRNRPETRNRPTLHLTKEQRQFTAESTDCLSTNDAKTTGHPQANTETTRHPGKRPQQITDLTVGVKASKAPGR